VDPEPISFEASVQTRHGGKEVWRRVGISAPATGKPLAFRLPTSILGPGDFLLFVRGAALREAQSPLQEYSLRVSYIDASATPNGASPH